MSVFNNAISGISASSSAINILSENTSHAMQPDYTRKRVNFTSDSTGGVMIDSVQRVTDQYKTATVRRSETELKYQETKSNYSSIVEKIISQPSVNLSESMSKLTNAFSSAAEQPTSQARRQEIINESSNIVAQIKELNDGLKGLRHQNRSELKGCVNQTNTLLKNINKLNQQISVLPAGEAISVLQDQRDGLINKLAGMTSIRVAELRDKTVTITLKNGQPLLSAGDTTLFEMDPSTFQINAKFGCSKFPIKMELGGKIGALIANKEGPLKQAEDYLNEFATKIASTVNDELNKGYALNGKSKGINLFSLDKKNAAESIVINKNLVPEDLALSSKKDEPGNSENIKKILMELQIPKDFNSLGSTQSLSVSYSSLITNISAAVNQDESNAKAAKVLNKSAIADQLSVSGVNLNEEAANLVLYQQTYQANSKVFSVAEKLFQSILSGM